MEDIIEHFGSGFLSIVSGIILFAFFVSLLRGGGILFELVENYMKGICG